MIKSDSNMLIFWPAMSRYATKSCQLSISLAYNLISSSVVLLANFNSKYFSKVDIKTAGHSGPLSCVVRCELSITPIAISAASWPSAMLSNFCRFWLVTNRHVAYWYNAVTLLVARRAGCGRIQQLRFLTLCTGQARLLMRL